MNNHWWKNKSELDPKQQGLFDLSIEESHLLLGPPGSGKTNLLLLWASQLVLSRKQNILILVFTRTLREFIATGGSQYAFGVDNVKTLDAWRFEFLREQGITPDTDDNFDTRRRLQLDQIQAAIQDRKLATQYNAIILDEAQDYLPEELDIFEQLGQVVFAAGDSRQKIYVTDKTSADALQLRFKGNVYTLKHHYRNGLSICKVADSLAKSWGGYDFLEPTSNYNESEYPSSVKIHGLADLDEQIQVLISTLQLQMKAYPDELLGVLCPSRAVLRAVSRALMSSAVSLHCVIQSSEDGYVQFDDDKPICVSTIHGAKGLEFRAVHILDSENIKKSSLNRNIAYTAVTRAKTSLAIYHSKALPPYLDSALNVIRPPVERAKLDQLFGEG